MIYTDPLFLGVTPTGVRNYVADKLVSLKKAFFNACAGRFSVVEAAIKVGLSPLDVHASDIGLFSSIIGYLADPSKKLADLAVRVLDPALEPKDVKDELDFGAHVMLILKLNQMKQTNLRGLYLREELFSSWERIQKAMRDDVNRSIRLNTNKYVRMKRCTVGGSVSHRCRLQDVWDKVRAENQGSA